MSVAWRGLLAAGAILWTGAACGQAGDASTGRVQAAVQTSAPESAGARDAGAPLDSVQAPSAHEVIRVLLRELERPLSADASCAGVGARSDDRTVGDYLAGFLAALSDSSGANWVDVRSARAAGGVSGWQHDVLLRRRAGEEEWAWGVRFVQRMADGGVVEGTVRCIGG